MLPLIGQLDNPKLLKAAKQLSTTGKLAISENKLVYLDIDDNYIHQLFPLLQNSLIKKPDYFGTKSAGAHITVVYPEEQKIIKQEELHKEHSFTIKELVTAKIGRKLYYVLLVESLSLLHLRKKYHLPKLLNFRGYSIGFHITIGVQPDEGSIRL